MTRQRNKRRSVLPGFGISLGIVITYLTLVILLPLATIVLKASGLSWSEIWKAIASVRAIQAYKLSFGASAAAAIVNTVFGLLVAWVITRYKFPFRQLIDAIVDLPFALPTAVAGIALTQLCAPTGWIGSIFSQWGIKTAFSPLGVFIALTFIGLPFVVRSVQAVLEDLEPDLEEAAACMGARPYQTFFRVILPSLTPALCTGFILAFARALGEYGSVVFISGNMPMKTEIVPLLIMTKLEQFDYAGASALALTMLAASLFLMLCLNALQFFVAKRRGVST
ncbi:MAG: sulfate ABC transporter permease subunit CysT [SAR324 cluster bacterium]|uniref:Sulfate transport system permease protein CysT n=1 Tax=SAR324 cluster bacterium TaxID=2024889 RepID=A0A7X9FRG6_9DELT|nr:sulfate ABC transporter permease subunit CysT [SAR324 cluster bacterium]